MSVVNHDKRPLRGREKPGIVREDLVRHAISARPTWYSGKPGRATILLTTEEALYLPFRVAGVVLLDAAAYHLPKKPNTVNPVNPTAGQGTSECGHWSSVAPYNTSVIAGNLSIGIERLTVFIDDLSYDESHSTSTAHQKPKIRDILCRHIPARLL